MNVGIWKLDIEKGGCVGMGRPKNEKSEKAEKLYLKGLSATEIAKTLNVPDSTVRRWKSTYKWKKPKKENRTFGNIETERSELNARSLAQIGNTNAVGHKGRNRPGNQNARTHGAYCKNISEALEPEEISYIDSMAIDAEEILIEQIKSYTARELYLSKQIMFYENNADANRLILSNTYSQVVEEDFTGDRARKGTAKTVHHAKESVLDAIVKLNAELSKVQANKLKAVAALAKLHKDMIEIDHIINGGITAEAEPIMIYLPDNARGD